MQDLTISDPVSRTGRHIERGATIRTNRFGAYYSFRTQMLP